MIRQHGYKTEKEAEQAAEALLWKYRDEKGSLSTTSHKRINDKGEALPIYRIVDNSTGAMACVCKLIETYNVIFLTAEEAKRENRTYPYRQIREDMIPFLLSINTPIFKPVAEIRIDEAFTPENVEKVNSFFGIETIDGDFMTAEQIQERLPIDDAFEEWEDEEGNVEITSLSAAPYPEALTQLTGVKVRNVADYIKGIKKLLHADLTEMQEDAIRETYLFNTSSVFLRYAIYEFFRTEDYRHLKEVLSSYKKVGLPKDWEGETYILSHSLSAETYTIARYIATRGHIITGDRNRVKDIAEYTNTPLPLMIKASRIKHLNDF